MYNKSSLFLLNSLPHNNTAGGILYDQIAQSYGVDNVSILGVSGLNKNSFSKYTNNGMQFQMEFPNTNMFWKVLKKLPLFEEIYSLFRYFIIRKSVLAHIKLVNPEIIFVQIRGNSLFFIGDIVKSFNVKLIGMIEDTVEREIDGHYISYRLKKKIYYKYLTNMSKIGVAGETMKSYIENKFKIEAVIIRPWYNRISDANKNIKHNLVNINIFFAGNVYAKKEFSLFLKALDHFAITHKKYKITFFIASRKKFTIVPNNYKIIQLGWLDEIELKKYIDAAHFSYLPYIFDSKYEHSMRYAFPGKVGFYVTNNLPIFFHGPKHSSVNTFLKSYKVGVSCDSMEINSIVKSITELISDNVDIYNAFQEEIKRVYQLEYTEAVFKNRITQLFNV